MKHAAALRLFDPSVRIVLHRDVKLDPYKIVTIQNA